MWQNSTSQATPLSTHQMAAKIYIEKLNLTAAQRSQILRLYSHNAIEDSTYFPDKENEQIAATALLAAHHLDLMQENVWQAVGVLSGGLTQGKAWLQTGKCCISGD